MDDVTPPDGEDKPELGALSVQPAPPQDTESVASVSVWIETLINSLKAIEAVHARQASNTKAMGLRELFRLISMVLHNWNLEASGDMVSESNCTPNIPRILKKEPNWEDGSEEFGDRSKRKRKRDVADGITDMTPATKRSLNTDGEDKPELGALSVQPAPPQDTESVAFVSVGCQTVQQCFNPIKIEPPDEPVMGDVTPPDGEDKPELGALSVQPAPPQDTESVAFVSVGCQTVQQCFKPIKIEPPDEPVMGDVTPPVRCWSRNRL
ncbi:uncharacterized protein LOC114457880 isoform X2 [Gouania willdenowi]|uniref:uncharacterized protein LOC114457880 isoform X2 n=1 Tax=Gouania willdenowi TaxID=441366 RepID=UPI0010560F4E|nr:uncharacterized protein LOC114457880 isoform X2 [Gouania willdenowi]